MAIPKRLDYAEWDPIPGVSTAGFDHEDNPTWKLLLHTTEGGSYVSARSAYHGNGFSPHSTVGVYKPELKVVRAWQHVNFDERSTTLGEDPGGIRVGRDYVIQIEIIGFADLAYARRFGYEHLYIHNWADWYVEGIAEVCNDIIDLLPIPRRCTVTWVDYPASYGKNASQRLTTAQYDAYQGILGHQHAPENTHGDPGDLDEFVRHYLLGEDMPLTNADVEKITEAHLAALGTFFRRNIGTYNESALSRDEALLYTTRFSGGAMNNIKYRVLSLLESIRVKVGADPIDEEQLAQQLAVLLIPAIVAELPQIPAEQIEEATERAIRRVLGSLDEEETP